MLEHALSTDRLLVIQMNGLPLLVIFVFCCSGSLVKVLPMLKTDSRAFINHLQRVANAKHLLC